VPKQVYSDQGAQFESQIVAEICKLLHIDKTRTTPYHPQSDGLIERFNRTLIQILATCAETHPFDWEDHVKKVCLAYNVSKQSSTQHSPFFLMFGRHAQLPIDIMYGTLEQQTDTMPQYVSKLTQTLGEAFADARKQVSVHQERQAEQYNKKVHGKPHQPGDLVWLFNPAVPRGKPKKFHRPWTGPYRVIDKLSDNGYRIKNTQRPFKIKVVHFDRLKVCQPGTCFPQMISPLSTKQPNPTKQSSTPPIGTNVEILDDDPAPLPPRHRYPQRHNRCPPSRYADFRSH